MTDETGSDAMMSVGGLLHLLRTRGVQLTVAGDRLRAAAPPGVIDHELGSAIARFKPELIAMIMGEQQGATAPGESRLTSAQERLWLFQKLEPTSSTYNSPVVVRLDGTLDVAGLEGALRRVLDRHEPLRSIVVDTPYGGAMRILAPPQDVVAVVDLSQLPHAAQTAAAYAQLREAQHRPFDLARDMPFRATLLRLRADRHVLVASTHHIAVDGVSLQHFVRELVTAYAGEELPALRTTFRAHAAWERAYWTADRLAARAGFWRTALAGAPLVLQFPTDRPREAKATYDGGLEDLALDALTDGRVRALAQSERASPFMALLAAYAAALHRHSGQRDLVVGTPLHGREQAALSDLIGMFVNQLPLRMQVGRDDSYRDLLRQAREAVLGSMTEHEMPFGALVDALGVPRDESRTPVFQALLNVSPTVPASHDMTVRGVTFSVPSARELSGGFDGQSKFDVTLYASVEDDGQQLRLVYNAALFESARMRELLSGVGQILRLGSEQPDRPLAELMPYPRHVAREVRAASSGAPPAAQSVPEQVARIAAFHAHRPAVIGADGDLSYATLLVEALRVARVVAAATPGDPERPVGIVVPHDADAVVALLGVLTSGHPYVPLDPAYPAERLRFMVQHAELRVVLTTPELRERAADMIGEHGRVITVHDEPAPGTPQPPMPRPEDVAYLLFTSGSSGRPKAVVQSHGNLLQQVTRYAEALSLAPADRLAWLASISFDASLMDVFGGLTSGASVCPIDARAIDLGRLPGQLSASRISVLHVTPTVFRTIARVAISAEFPTLRAVVLGGEAVRQDEVRLFDEHLSPDAVLFNLYGASEHSFSFGGIVDRHRRTVEVPIGWPVGDTEALLLDGDGHPDPVSGELVLRSGHTALGYWKSPDLTARAFPPDAHRPGARLYRTGDIVRRRPDGAYLFLERRDQQLKVRGHRIEAYEVEGALQAHAAIAEAAVHAPADATGDAVLTACIVLRPDAAGTSVAELVAWCADRLPAFMVPAGWQFLDRLPRTPSGKLDRRSLPAPAAPAVAERDAFGPRDAIEAEVLQLWRDILGVVDMGVNDDFFVLGGNSLSATQVVSRVRESLEVELPLRRFFDHPTVADTAAWIRDSRGGTLSVPPLLIRDKVERMPLSFSQERIWFLQQLDQAASAYNMASAMLVDGLLDVGRLRRAVHAVAMEQESLRTSFPVESGRPAQVVAAEPDHAFDAADVSGYPDVERLDRARALAEACVEPPYDLERGPLFRVLVVRMAEDRFLIAIGLHHIVSDLWSFAVLARALRHAYERDGAIEPRDGVTYRDYAAWQRDWLRGDALGVQLEYWRRKLAGIGALEIPTDLPRPALMSFDGDSVRTPLPPTLRERLRQFSTGQRATPFMTLLAAFNVLLARYSRQSDIAVGVPIAGRQVTATQDLVGSFVNTLVHRNDLSGDPSFRELVQRVRANALEAYAHQDAPFELLVKELQPARNTSRQPLVQVLFNVANVRVAGALVEDVRHEVVPLRRNAAQFDLILNIGLNDVQSDVQLTFNTTLFVRPTAERLLAEYVELLERGVDNPALTLSQLEALSEAQRARQVDEWNDTARPLSPDASVPRLIEATAREHAARCAVASPTGTFTHGELLDYAQRVTAALQALGIARGDRVAVVMQRSREMLGALLGILGTGAAYVPVDPAYPEARVRFMLDDSGAAAIVTHRELERRFERRIPTLDLDRWAPPEPVSFVAIEEGHAAYVIYTSGSTGRPKGVEVSHRGMANFLLAMRNEPGMGVDDVLLAVTTISFDIAVLELYLPLVTGGRVVIAGEDEVTDGRRLMRRAEEAGATLMQATPATWKLLIAAGWRGSPSLRILCGGEALTRSLADDLLRRSCALWNMYGPTETTVWSTFDRVTPDGPILVGRPIANTTLYVVDELFRELPIGVPGELYIGGAGVANGYVNLPELTGERFLRSPFKAGERIYRTGDLVRRRHDGRVQHLGRLDDQVKVLGFRIELGEVESALRSHEAVHDAVVVVRDDRLTGYIVFQTGQHATNTELRNMASRTLPAHMVPAQFVVLDALPLTSNGKVDRKALPDPDRQAAGSPHWESPADPLSRVIAGVWTELLGVTRVGLNDNFFEIGGHSLLAMESIALIEQRTGRRLDPRLLFFKTVRELAATLATAPAAE